jgi:ComEC/Rec2-related protein
MLFPAPAAAGRLLWIITAVLLGITGILTLMIAMDRFSIRAWFVPLALAAAFVFGYARHLSVYTFPDQSVAKLVVGADGTVKTPVPITLPDTCRIRMVKSSDTRDDITLRFAGILYARTPADTANPIDDKGRWRFMIDTVPVTSRVVTVKASDPVGTWYSIPTPFNIITAIECLEGNGPAALEIWRVSNHASSFARKGRFRPSVSILGKITQDPQVRTTRTLLSITPDFIQYDAGGPYYRVTGGDLQVMLYPETPGYHTFARTAAYGYHITCHGELRRPLGAANPGDFDQKRYMYNHNFYGTLFLQNPTTNNPGIRAVAPADGSFFRGNWLVEFSLDLRDDMLATIKQTLPMPHSAFVGAVTLGMRYGLSDAPTLFSDYYRKRREGISRAEYENLDVVHTGYEDTIADEFRRAGVNHVLAVSGLHVTIITAMFVGIFTVLRIPRRMFVPPTIFALVIFAIITGARPSTLRAVIMNSLFLLTWAYLERGLRSAALFGVAVAGFLILIHNPLMIVDPSFTLSFGAILSLVLMTGPAYAQLSKLRGNMFIVFLLFLGISTVLGIRYFGLFMTPAFLIPYSIAWLGIAWLAKKAEPYVHPIGDIGYQDLPTGFSGFFAAQFAIQIGMMLPLSAYYFARWPFGGAYANLIAIPLIGVIVQLGVIAGLLGLIPGVGMFLALVLSAANWLCSTLFLYVSHVVAQGFPYPFVPRPSLWMLFLYYLVCLAVVYYQPLMRNTGKLLERVGFSRPWHARAAIGALFLILVLPLLLKRNPDKGLLNISVLSVRYGSSILVETPQGAHLLFDAGAVGRGQRKFNNAIRTVLPYLSRQGVLHLDAAVMTSPNIQRSAGMADILNELQVDRLFVPPSIYGLSSTVSEDDFKKYILNNRDEEDPDSSRFRVMYRELIDDYRWPKRLSLMKVLHKRRPGLLNTMASYAPKVLPLDESTVIWKETGPGGTPLTIDVIHPDSRHFSEKNLENRSPVIRIRYGTFSMLLPGDLHFEGQEHLARKYTGNDLRSSIFVIPGHGAITPFGEYNRFDTALRSELQAGLVPLMQKASPDAVIFEYGDPRYVMPQSYREMRSAYDFTTRFISEKFPRTRLLSTDKDQAIMIASDGKGYRITTQAELQADAGEAIGEGTGDIGYGF